MANTLKDIILLKRTSTESLITENSDTIQNKTLHGELILCDEKDKERLYCKNSSNILVPIHHKIDSQEKKIEKPKPEGAVDLGLPSGKLWAKCNLGASSEEEYGLYYQWGDTQGYSAEQVGTDKQFTWNDYKFSIDGSDTNFSKYSLSDSKTQLDLEDDAVYAALGGNWRMPTKDDFEELTAYTTTEVTSISGIQGMKFASKNNSNYLFFPFAGYAYLGSMNGVGSGFPCWSSTLYSVGSNYAWYLSAYSGGDMNLRSNYRRGGQSVRGVLSL